MKNLLFLLLLLLNAPCFSQSYSEGIYSHREKYKQDFLSDEHSPLKESDTSYLRFFKPDKNYRFTAVFEKTNDSIPFEMPTHSGKIKMYRKYGTVHFTLKKKHYTLEVYQSIALMQKEEWKDYLFLPFYDLTNYETTYGGGRYLDLSLNDIKNATVELDFNKCYNPYCAYAAGYSCPIPPAANKLDVPIEAGEKLFGKEVTE